MISTRLKMIETWAKFYNSAGEIQNTQSEGGQASPARTERTQLIYQKRSLSVAEKLQTCRDREVCPWGTGSGSAPGPATEHNTNGGGSARWVIQNKQSSQRNMRKQKSNMRNRESFRDRDMRFLYQPLTWNNFKKQTLFLGF